MTDSPVFLDTNLFLCYATDFEKNHTKSCTLFHGRYSLHTGIRVKMELNKIKRRRAFVYKDLCRFFEANMTISSFKPSVMVKKSDAIHLRHLLNHIKSMDKSKVLTHLRRIGRLIDEGVCHALTFVIRPLIKPSGDLSCERQMERCVGNANDARILADSLCWAEDDGPAIFCTQDYSDIISKRHAIYQSICRIRAYSPEEKPLKIMSLDELVT